MTRSRSKMRVLLLALALPVLVLAGTPASAGPASPDPCAFISAWKAHADSAPDVFDTIAAGNRFDDDSRRLLAAAASELYSEYRQGLQLGGLIDRCILDKESRGELNRLLPKTFLE